MHLGAKGPLIVLKVGDRDLTNGNGNHASDDHSGLAVGRPGPIGSLPGVEQTKSHGLLWAE